MSAHALLLFLLLLVLGWQCSPPDLNRERRLAVFPRRTSTASQKICQKECQKRCQKECQKMAGNNVRKNVRMKECRKICPKECQNICQKTFRKNARKMSNNASVRARKFVRLKCHGGGHSKVFSKIYHLHCSSSTCSTKSWCVFAIF